MLEQEYKAIIDTDTYYKLSEHFTWDSVREQTNHYYTDKDGILARGKIMVRIRETDEEYKIQVKKHLVTETLVHTAQELEFDTNGVASFIDAKKAYEITGVKTDNLYKVGALSTKRHSLIWNDTTEICLDMSKYFDITDYEIEVEYTNEEPVELLEELKKLGISFNVKGKGKYSRFITRMAELSKQIK